MKIYTSTIQQKYSEQFYTFQTFPSILLIQTRPTLERRKTLGHLRSINCNMVIHFANQSQTCQLLKILKNIFFSNISWKETVKYCNQSQVELVQKTHIDYQARHIYIYNMSSSCYYIFNHLSQCTGMIKIYRVGDSRRTVNTSTTPHISDQLWTENECETLLCWFIIVIRALFSDNMYRYGRHFRSFYRNPTAIQQF